MAQTLENALARLHAVPGIQVLAVSSVYKTEPQGVKDQPWFVNRVAKFAVDASMTPQGLLAILHDVERAFGRQREGEQRFGPRPIDLDVLAFGDIIMTTPELIVPHPRMCKRAFVLVPLVEIAPDWKFPGGESATKVLSRLDYHIEGDIIRQSDG